MIDLYQLKQLIVIARTGTLSKASQELHISQPALTRSMQRLEEDLGFPLFDRKKNKITLNETGELAIQYANNILKEQSNMIEHLQRFHRRRQTISIGSCAPMPLLALHYLFHQNDPDRKMEDDMDAREQVLIDGLLEHRYSIIVTTHPVEEKDLCCVEMFEEYLYLSVPPAHPFAMMPELSFHDLDGESVLLLSRIGFWNEICLKMIPQSHLLIQEDTETFHELTRLSALPNFRSNITIDRETKEDNRISIPIMDKEAHVMYYAVYHKKDAASFSFLSHEIKQIDWSKITAFEKEAQKKKSEA